MHTDPVGLLSTQLRYYLGIDPDLLEDEEWACEIARLKKVREMENKK